MESMPCQRLQKSIHHAPCVDLRSINLLLLNIHIASDTQKPDTVSQEIIVLVHDIM